MRDENIVSEILQFETKQGFFEIELHGVPLWERMRTKLPRKIKKARGIIDEPHRYPSSSSGSKWVRYGELLKQAVMNAPSYQPFRFDTHEMLVWGHERRKKQPDGYWWDIYTDPIYEHEELDYVHFEREHAGGHLQPAKTANLFYTDEISTYARILRKLGYGPDIDRREVEPVRDIERKVRSRFGVDLDTSEGLARDMQIEYAEREIYSAYLDRIDPAITVVVVSYGKEPFILTCKRERIPVVELQHGVIHEGHFAYHYPGERTKKAFPDYLLVWGEFWRDCVEYPIPDERVIPVGYPYLEQSLDRYDDVTSTDQILFISQGTIGEQFSKFALAVDEHPGIDHDIVYKLHPGEYYQWQEEYPWLADANFEVIDSSEPGLYQLFAESSVQVGVGSTAVYEGLCFDLETYVYDCPGSLILQPLVEEGAAKILSSTNKLASLLGTGGTTFEREYYFEPNATAKTGQVLQRLTRDASITQSTY